MKSTEREDAVKGRGIYGRLHVDRLIGKGGVAFVHLAHDIHTHESFALKILRPEMNRDRLVRSRFRKEGKLVRQLDHPNLMKGVHFGVVDDVQFFVAEYLEGGTLEELVLREKKLDPVRAIRIMVGILNGLQYLHRRGAAHLDVKPDNVMFDGAGEVKLIDFGSARGLREPGNYGPIMGTPSYLSPQQGMGQLGDTMCDLYSCGVLLFVMLTGKRPFQGTTAQETLDMHQSAPVPPIPDAPRGLEAVVHRLMAKDPADRFATAREAALALRDTTTSPPKQGIFGTVLLGVAVFLLALWGLWKVFPPA